MPCRVRGLNLYFLGSWTEKWYATASGEYAWDPIGPASKRLAQSDLYNEEAVNKHDHTQCPVCSAPIKRDDEVIENVKVATKAECSACGLYSDHMDGGVADERIGFYVIHGTWQIDAKPIREKLIAERALAIEEAKSILVRGGWPVCPEGGDARFTQLVQADWLDDGDTAPVTSAFLRTEPASDR